MFQGWGIFLGFLPFLFWKAGFPSAELVKADSLALCLWHWTQFSVLEKNEKHQHSVFTLCQLLYIKKFSFWCFIFKQCIYNAFFFSLINKCNWNATNYAMYLGIHPNIFNIVLNVLMLFVFSRINSSRRNFFFFQKKEVI